ncbi:MAG: type II secretion system major pseudopilin GspG [Pseudomonadota bacterium]
MRVNNQNRTKSDRTSEAGYSLLEILVVLAIIASLAALVGPRLIGQVDKSKVTTAKVQIEMLETALTDYYTEVGILPNASEGLEVLVKNVTNHDRWRGPYLDLDAGQDLPLDPWGSPYQYRPPTGPGQIGTVFSMGADREIGGSGQNADIT